MKWSPTSFGPLTYLVPKKFCPREISSPRSLGPEKFHLCMKIIIQHFHAGTNFRGAQNSRGPNFSGTKKVRGPNEVGDHFSYISLRSLRSEDASVGLFLNLVCYVEIFKSNLMIYLERTLTYRFSGWQLKNIVCACFRKKDHHHIWRKGAK